VQTCPFQKSYTTTCRKVTRGEKRRLSDFFVVSEVEGERREGDSPGVMVVAQIEEAD